MKKFVSLLLALMCVLAVPAFAEGETVKLTIGATPVPHAEILEAIKPQLEAKGIELEVIIFNDYVQPNVALAADELDANYFQHKPYMDDFNAGQGSDLVALIPVHYEPLGLFPSKTASIDALADGATIAVPNDTTNEARALLLLESVGIIKIDPAAGLNATKLDIVENPKNISIEEVEAAQLPRVLPDVDMAVINGNYALSAGLNAATDALAQEASDSLAAMTYVNYVVVNGSHKDDEVFATLAEVLTSEETQAWINEKYQGAVVPFTAAIEAAGEELADIVIADVEAAIDAEAADATDAE